MTPTPKTLILNLLLAAGGIPLSAGDAVRACGFFGMRDNSVRVALARLTAEGLLASAGRGAYVLGGQARDLAQALSSWRQAESQLCAWQGSWVMASTAGLGRTDRTALRRRERALALAGFKELNEGLFVRPDNLIGGPAALRSRLVQLGLEAGAPVFAASQFDAALEERARHLWEGEALSRAYAHTRLQLRHWLKGAHRLPAEVAARESYLLGHDAIRQLVFDPLLPSPLVDTAARRAFIETVIAFDEAGHRIWRSVLPGLGAQAPTAKRAARPLTTA